MTSGQGASNGSLPPDEFDEVAQQEFEKAVERTFGNLIRNDDAVAVEMWSALAGIIWQDKSGKAVWYSFRSASELIWQTRNSGHSMDWYCSGPKAVVSPRIESALAIEGWSWKKAL